MATINGLPVFYIKINEDLENKTGIDFVSLVDCPAIESNWVAMAEKKPLKFATDNEKQLLLGPILIPDKPIYRYDLKMGEYFVVFKKEEIEKLVRKFQASQKTINLNYQHQENSQIKQAVIQEIWLSGKTDKSKDFGFDHAEGSAFVVAHIGDKKFWDEEVKTGKVLGFSIEGFLDMELKKQNQFNMSNQKFEVHRREGGGDVFVDGPVAVDSYVFSNYPSITLVDGKKQITQYPVWEETILLEDGTILSLKDAKIIKVEKKQSMSKQKFITAKTDKGVELYCDGEKFEVGMDVYTMADGNKSAAPDGEHNMENGSVIKVENGKISSIIENQADEVEAEKVIQSAVQPLIDKIKTDFDKIIAEQKTAFEAEIKELKTKLSNLPGAPSATEKNDGKETKPLSAKEALELKMSIAKKKLQELNTK